MKTNCLLFIILFQFLCFFSFGQVVIKNQRTIGGSDYDYFRSMGLTKEGGLIVGGNSYSGASGEKTDNITGGWVVKLNNRGLITWDTTYDDFVWDLASVQQTCDKGYILGGTTYDYAYSYPVIDKTDSTGKIQWGKALFDNYGSYESLVCVQQRQNNNGYIAVTDAYGFCYVYLFDNSGNQLQQTYIPMPAGVALYVHGCVQTQDDGLIIVGSVYNDFKNTSFDFAVVKLDNKGHISWEKIIGGDNDDECTTIEQLNDGSYIAGGYSNSNISGNKSENNKGGYDYWLVHLDRTGNIMGDKTIGGAKNDYLHALQKTSDGGFIAGGTSSSDASGDKTENGKGGSDYWIVKLSDMKIQWDKTIGGDTTDDLSSIKEVCANNYVLGGSSLSGISGDKTQACRGNFDYWLVEINTTDNLIAHNSDKQIKSASIIDKDFSVYPNPVKDVLNIHASGSASFSLIDQSGKILLIKHITTSGSMNVSDLAAGVYYLKNNSTNTVVKIVIER
jgi:hypothetical protein